MRPRGLRLSVEVVCLLVGLACPQVPICRAAQVAGPLSVGTAMSDITPAPGASMNGGMADRKATHIDDELHASCVVFGNGQPTQPATADHEFTLVREGRGQATIVLARDASGAARFAAGELREHVKRITGVELPVVGDDARTDTPRVLVGPSTATQALGIPTADLKSQEYLIRFLPEALVLLGKDGAGTRLGESVPARAAGRFGRAMRFDGRNDIVRVPACGFDDDLGTMEAWVWMPAKTSPGHGTILRLDGSEPWTYHIIQRDPQTSRISYTTYDGTNGHQVVSGTLGEGWHYVAGTHDALSGKMELFIDGVSSGTATYVRTTCHNAVLGIGAVATVESVAKGNPFAGLIDEVRISRMIRDVKAEAGGRYSPDAHTTCLLHFDEEGGPARNVADGAPPPELFADNGTLYAVYYLLERFCGVRWYAPGEIGLVCPRTNTLAVRGKDLRRAPAMIHRWIAPTPLFMPGPPQQIPAPDMHLWKLRMGIGGQPFSVSHSFYGCYDRFLKEHPDWFAQGYTGQPPQMCYTSPEFINQVIADARAYFDGKGKTAGATAEGDVYGLVPMDNVSWCKCPRCQAELNRMEQANQQFNNGKASDYIFNFINRVAHEIRKTHPNKWIGALAYSDFAYYPVKTKVEPNVVVQMCLHTRNWWCPSMEANDRRMLDEWRTRDPQRPLYLWLYYCFPALNAQIDKYHYFPGLFAHTLVSQMALYRQADIRGIFMEHSGEFGQTYLMDQLEFYVTLKLADDPTLNGEQLIDEFFVKYYGAAALAMKELYEKIEQTFSDPRSYPPEIQQSKAHQHQNATLAWVSLGTAERMQEFERLMALARQDAHAPIEKQRVEMFATGILDYMREGRRLFLQKTQAPTQTAPN